jgi:flagellar basal-body rod modification protein FlgD
MSITSTTGVGTGTSAADAAAASGSGNTNALGKDSFLKLLITQMQNPDPLSPMDNTTFLAQLAQFSSLEQMQNLNDKFDASMALSQSLNNSAAAGLIGRHVRASGDTVQLGASGSVDLGYFLPQEADSVTVTIYDANGNLVRTLPGQPASTGANSFQWDGNNSSGARAGAGAYTFKVAAVGQDGSAIQATSLVDGTVDGVTYKNGMAYLMVDGREVTMADLLEVGQSGSQTQGH